MAQVTVVVPSLNQAPFIEDALRSIIDQKVEKEIFVMDGGSTDGTMAIVDSFAEHLAGYRSHPDGGQAQAINEGVRLGAAEYVCWLNSDDWFLSNGLDRLVQAIRHNPNRQAPAAYGQVWNYNQKNGRCHRVRVERFDERRLALRCIISQPGTIIRRDVWEEVGGLNENLTMALDYDLWWRVYRRFGPLLYADSDVAINRVHADTKTNRFRRAHYREAMSVVKAHYGSIPLKWWLYQPYAVWWKSLRNSAG